MLYSHSCTPPLRCVDDELSNSKFAPEKLKDGKDRHLPKKDRYFIQGLSQGSYAPEI